MATVLKPDPKSRIVDKKTILRILAEQDAITGFVEDPTATAEKVREMMLADGVDPTNASFSRDIIAARDE